MVFLYHRQAYNDCRLSRRTSRYNCFMTTTTLKNHSKHAASLLGPRDDAPFEVFNPDGRSPVLLVCDHASNHIPEGYDNLGLAAETLAENHIAWDIGAASVTRGLAHMFGSPAVLSCYSRLLIDCNRQPGAPDSIPAVSDNIAVLGNQNISDREAERRLETFFWPYHHAITNTLAQLWRHGPAPAVIAVHSFTPVFNGLRRPWDIGVLWNHDPRIARPLLHWLREHHDFCVGDNEPYSGRDVGFTLDHHAGAAGLPHICLEIRQDLIADEAGCKRWTAIVGEALEAVLSNASLHNVEHY